MSDALKRKAETNEALQVRTLAEYLESCHPEFSRQMAL